LVVLAPFKITAHPTAIGGRWIRHGPPPCFATNGNNTTTIWRKFVVHRHR